MTTYSAPQEVVEKTFAYNTANIATGVKVCDLAPDDLVEDIEVDFDTVFNGVTSSTVEVGIADDDLNPKVALATYDAKAGPAAGADISPAAAPATGTSRGGRAVTSGAVYVKNTDVGGAATAGAGRVRVFLRRADAAQGAYAPASSTPTMTVGSGQSHSYKS